MWWLIAIVAYIFFICVWNILTILYVKPKSFYIRFNDAHATFSFIWNSTTHKEFKMCSFVYQLFYIDMNTRTFILQQKQTIISFYALYAIKLNVFNIQCRNFFFSIVGWSSSNLDRIHAVGNIFKFIKMMPFILDKSKYFSHVHLGDHIQIENKFLHAWTFFSHLLTFYSVVCHKIMLQLINSVINDHLRVNIK